ncbi:MAG TPA: hypothetical protein VI520_08670 [Anaerolineales bacterium]|nr:hypothetical protein [Anaerolineales bacterium]
MNKLEIARILSSLLASVFARPVQYLDPGSGSYLLQLLIAGILGALFALRLYWRQVKGFFLKLLKRGGDEEER